MDQTNTPQYTNTTVLHLETMLKAQLVSRQNPGEKFGKML